MSETPKVKVSFNTSKPLQWIKNGVKIAAMVAAVITLICLPFAIYESSVFLVRGESGIVEFLQDYFVLVSTCSAVGFSLGCFFSTNGDKQ